jgi:nicotinamidase-related amidase
MSIPELKDATLMTKRLHTGPVADHLITPQNAALILIDDQPAQFATVRSMDPGLLLNNIVSTVETAKSFGLPIVHSTINLASGRERLTVPEYEEGT